MLIHGFNGAFYRSKEQQTKKKTLKKAKSNDARFKSIESDFPQFFFQMDFNTVGELFFFSLLLLLQCRPQWLLYCILSEQKRIHYFHTIISCALVFFVLFVFVSALIYFTKLVHYNEHDEHAHFRIILHLAYDFTILRWPYNAQRMQLMAICSSLFSFSPILSHISLIYLIRFGFFIYLICLRLLLMSLALFSVLVYIGCVEDLLISQTAEQLMSKRKSIEIIMGW